MDIVEKQFGEQNETVMDFAGPRGAQEEPVFSITKRDIAEMDVVAFASQVIELYTAKDADFAKRVEQPQFMARMRQAMHEVHKQCSEWVKENEDA